MRSVCFQKLPYTVLQSESALRQTIRIATEHVFWKPFQERPKGIERSWLVEESNKNRTHNVHSLAITNFGFFPAECNKEPF